MKKIVGVSLALLLAGCAVPERLPEQPEGHDASPSASAAALPTERNASTPECYTALRQASLKIIEPAVSVGECDSLVSWLSGVDKFPASLGLAEGEAVTVEHLAGLCKGYDSAPVCADAIKQGLIESTGDDVKPNLLAKAARSCQVDSDLTDEQSKLQLILGTEATTGRTHAPETVECVLDALGAPAEVKARLKETTTANGKTDTWEGVKADWAHDAKSGLSVTLTWQG